MSHILVTGGQGFLGKALVRKLQEEGLKTISIHSKQCDLSKPEAAAYLQSISPDFVFHLAGKTGIALSWENPSAYYRANLDATRNVLEYCRIQKIPMHYVSGYIYGNQGDLPIDEKAVPQPNNPYAHSKWMAEEMCRYYVRFFSLPITISRPFNIYGPNQKTDFFIPAVIKQIQNQKEIRVFNSDLKRDYIFIDDAADALAAIMKWGKAGECYNIGSGSSFSCKEAIAMLQKIIGTNKPVISENRTNKEEILHTQANIDKIKSEMSWRPKYSFSEGLAKCL